MTRIESIRRALGMSAFTLGGKVGVSDTTIRHIERRKSRTNRSVMANLSEVLGEPLDSLFDEDGLAAWNRPQPPSPPSEFPCAVASPEHPDEQWIRIDEAASLLGSCPSTIESLAFDRGAPRGDTPRLSDNGRLPYIVRDGEDYIRFSRPWLLAYKDGRKPPAVPNRWQRAIQDARKPSLNVEQMQLFESLEAAAAEISQQPNGVSLLQNLASMLQAAIKDGRKL